MPPSVHRTYKITEEINALIREPWEQSRQHNYPSLPQYKQLLKDLQPLMTEIDFVNIEFYPDWLSLIVFGAHACVSRFYSFFEKSGSKTTLPSWYNSTTQRIIDAKKSFISFLRNSLPGYEGDDSDTDDSLLVTMDLDLDLVPPKEQSSSSAKKTSTTSKGESAGKTTTQASKKSNKRKLAVAVSEEDEEPTFKAESSKAVRGPSKTKTPVVEIPIKSKNRGQQASSSGPKPVEPSEELEDAFLPAETRSSKGKGKDTGPSLKGLSYATALDLPAGKPGLLANSTLKHHEMMRQDREGEEEMAGYIYVNSTGNAFKAEELLETNYSTTQAAIAYLSCVSCACDAL
ncbi:hypothetical protein VKT23_005898 [Stygiomarasmius scandens]|uniref:Uncharacterized protein n=1 Tax=Marasmiellus scandens TaxID=2682957 RepID=A0ABR1JPK7_9AGAR